MLNERIYQHRLSNTLTPLWTRFALIYVLNVISQAWGHIWYSHSTMIDFQLWPHSVLSVMNQYLFSWWFIAKQAKSHRDDYNDVKMSAISSQITSVSIVYSTVCSGADQRKHQSSASLAFLRGIHRWLVNSHTKASNAENISIWWRHHEVERDSATLKIVV